MAITDFYTTATVAMTGLAVTYQIPDRTKSITFSPVLTAAPTIPISGSSTIAFSSTGEEFPLPVTLNCNLNMSNGTVYLNGGAAYSVKILVEKEPIL